MSRYDVAVIGAGIVGASAVHALARAGVRVVAIDAGVPGAGTSGNSFAWVNSVRKEPEIYHRLNAAGMAAYRDLARELDGVGYQERGSLEWAAAGEGESELRERVTRLAARGYAATWIPPTRAETLEPGLAIPGHVRDVAYFGGDGWLDAPRAVTRLLAEASKRGADVRDNTPVRSLRRRDDRVDAVVLDGGEIVADSVLVCAGPATQAVLAPLAAVPVGRVPGLLAVTSPPSMPLGRVVHVPGVHLRPDVSGGLLLGAGDLDGLVTETTPVEDARRIAARLIERAVAVFPPARGVTLVETRLGVRPMPSDGQTIAGRVPGLTNAWVLATHSGITLGPLLGRLIAEEIVGGPPSPTLAPFRAERFSR